MLETDRAMRHRASKRPMEKKAPMSAQKRNLLIGVFVAVALLVFLDPFQWLSPKPTPAKRTFSEHELTTIQAAFMADAQPAAKALVGLAASKRVTLVGIHLLVKEHFDFLAGLLPELATAGVRQVGVEFLLATDQADIDRLVAASAFDETLARRLFANWQPLCGYRENVDFLKAAWACNQGRAAGSPPLRIIGLSAGQDLSAVKSQDDFSKHEVLAKVFAAGVPDAFMAARVLEVAESGPVLVACQLQSSLSSWEERLYTAEMAKRGFAGQRRLGNLVHGALGEGCATALLAGPWPARQNNLGSAYPADGQVDQLIARLKDPAAIAFPAAWRLESAAIGASVCSNNDFSGQPVPSADGKTAPAIPRLKDLGSLLVAFGPTATLNPVTPIEGFVSPADRDDAIARMPQTGDMRQVTAEQLNESIRKVSEDMRTQLAKFK
jgi:hypothetical protein